MSDQEEDERFPEEDTEQEMEEEEFDEDVEGQMRDYLEEITPKRNQQSNSNMRNLTIDPDDERKSNHETFEINGKELACTLLLFAGMLMFVMWLMISVHAV
jgi:hypothetical protein